MNPEVFFEIDSSGCHWRVVVDGADYGSGKTETHLQAAKAASAAVGYALRDWAFRQRGQQKHTPGPWSYDCNYWGTMPHAAHMVRTRRNHDNGMSDEDGLMIVGVGDCGWENCDSAPSLSEADAHLISAAPDLLASCESLASALREYTDGKETPQQSEMLNLASAAIAKATGYSWE